MKTARDIMIHPVFAVRENWTVRELASYFIEKSISGAPVLDGSGRLTGVVSLSDIVDQVTRDREPAPASRHGWEGRYNSEDLRGLAIEDERPRRRRHHDARRSSRFRRTRRSRTSPGRWSRAGSTVSS